MLSRDKFHFDSGLEYCFQKQIIFSYGFVANENKRIPSSSC